MRLMRRGAFRAERPVVEVAGRTYAADRVTPDFDPDFFAGGGLDRLRDAVVSGALPEVDVAGARIGAPVARPGAVVCVGTNYAAHAAESGNPIPEDVLIFLKHPNCLRGPADEVPYPREATRVDYEVELAFVVGREAAYLESVEQGLACVAGYAVSNDLSERWWQAKRSMGQWSKGKCAEGFLPLGPALVVDEVGDPQTLGLRTWVNGELRQDSSTSDMIFGVGELVRNLSQFMVLSPGDLVCTGTPEGVALSKRWPFLQVGDVIEMEIDGLGRQRTVLGPPRPAGLGIRT